MKTTDLYRPVIGRPDPNGVDVTLGNQPSCQIEKQGNGYVTKRLILPSSSAVKRPAERRAIAVHELVHSRISRLPSPWDRKHLSEYTLQCAEDCRVQHEIRNTLMERSELIRRDQRTMALRDLRSITSAELSPFQRERDRALRLLIAIRSATTLGGEIPEIFGHRLAAILGEADVWRKVLSAASRLPNLLRTKHRRKALQDLQSFLFPPVPELPEEDEPDDMGNAIPDDRGELGKVAANNMNLIELPRCIPITGSIQLQFSRSGPQFVPGSLVPGYLAGRMPKLTLHAYPNPGSVLIDTSGSMRCKQEEFESLARSIPMGTVGYYRGVKGRGALWVYSRNGYRSNRLTYYDQIEGIAWGSANEVDYPAVQWLLRQPGPRYFVTDYGFTGPGHELVPELIWGNGITVISSVEAAMKRFTS